MALSHRLKFMVLLEVIVLGLFKVYGLFVIASLSMHVFGFLDSLRLAKTFVMGSVFRLVLYAAVDHIVATAKAVLSICKHTLHWFF